MDTLVLVPCPKCHGEKVYVEAFAAEPGIPARKLVHVCPRCGGEGVIQGKAERKIIQWCKCGNGTESVYYPNGDQEVKGSHWRCKVCGKVKEIG